MGMRRILVVEDELSLAKMMALLLRKRGYIVEVAHSVSMAMRRLDDGYAVTRRELAYDVILTDLRLGDGSGIEILRYVKQLDDTSQVVLVTAFASTETAVEAMKEGALDYIEKPFAKDVLVELVEQGIAKCLSERAKIVDRADRSVSLDEALDAEEYRFESSSLPVSKTHGLVGASAAMRQLHDMIDRVGASPTSVLLYGESGTGKELVARALHDVSGRQGPFVAVNCGAIAESLVEAELFGYVKGAFTGAQRAHDGFFVQADGGTLFLDEVAELSLSAQVKLLRAFQSRRIRPIGGLDERAVDIRIIAATHRNLFECVNAGTFREDLFYRLNVIRLNLPPLRERRDDLPLLVAYFIKQSARRLRTAVRSIDSEAIALLLSYDFPGNIRELENIIEASMTLETSDRLMKSTVLQMIPAAATAKHSEPVSQDTVLAEENVNSGIFDGFSIAEGGIQLENIVETVERGFLQQSLRQTGGNKTEAAKLLGINARSLRYRLKKYGLDSEDS